MCVFFFSWKDGVCRRECLVWAGQNDKLLSVSSSLRDVCWLQIYCHSGNVLWHPDQLRFLDFGTCHFLLSFILFPPLRLQFSSLLQIRVLLQQLKFHTEPFASSLGHLRVFKDYFPNNCTLLSHREIIALPPHYFGFIVILKLKI